MGIKQLHSITLNKFRVFSKAETFGIRPLTLLTGANNSGKSSILKALLLLSENAKKYNLEKLDFLTGKHNLHNFENALNDALPEKENPTFSFALEIVDSEDESYLYTVSREYINVQNEVVLNKMQVYAGNTLLAETGRGKAVFVNFAYFSQKFSQKEEKNKKSKSVSKEDIFIYQKKEKYALTHEKIQHLLTEISHSKETFEAKLGSKILDRMVDYCLLFTRILVAYSVSGAGIIAEIANPDSKISLYELGQKGNDFFQYVAKEITKIVAANTSFVAHNIDNLPAIRASNQRIILDSEPGFGEVLRTYFQLEWALITERMAQREKELKSNFIQERMEELERELNKHNNSGDKIIQVSKEEQAEITKESEHIVISQEERHEIVKDIHNNKDIHTEKPLNPYLAFVNKWLGKEGFNIADKIGLERLSDYGTIVTLHKNGKSYNLMDIGFGTSQLLPVIMKIAVSENQLLLLEEIENSLHPNYQAQLVALIIDGHKQLGVNYLIETHSEYFLNQIHLGIIKNELKEEELVLHFLSKEGKQNVYEITMLPNGQIKNAPTDFFKTYMMQTMDIAMNAQF